MRELTHKRLLLTCENMIWHQCCGVRRGFQALLMTGGGVPVSLCCVDQFSAPKQHKRSMYGYGHGSSKHRIASIIIQRIVRGFIGRRYIHISSLRLACTFNRGAARVVYTCPRPSTSRVGPLERIASLLSCVYASTTGKPWDQSAPRTFARTRTDCMYFRITPHANLARTQAQRPQAGRMSPPPALRLPEWVPSPAPEPLPPSCVRLWTSRRRPRPRPRPRSRSRRRARLPLKVCVTGTSLGGRRTTCSPIGRGV